jgi:hypothetical protein
MKKVRENLTTDRTLSSADYTDLRGEGFADCLHQKGLELIYFIRKKSAKISDVRAV